MIVYISDYREEGSKFFTDRDIGVKARQELKLDEIEAKENIIVRIPTDTWGINPSFFGGLFETSIKNMKEDFFTRYVFEYSNGEKIKPSLEQAIRDNFDYVIDSLG